MQMKMKMKTKPQLFKWQEEEEEEREAIRSLTSSSMAVGLRIVTQRTKLPSNVVIKYIKLLSASNYKNSASHHDPARGPTGDFVCFLQLCQLCHKKLRPDANIYMYRGDQGFCSEECRDRQILIDEMKELEASTMKMLSSSRNCYSSDNGGPKSETRLLLEERLHRRNTNIPFRKTGAITS